MSSAEAQQPQIETSAVKRGWHRWLPYLTLILLAELIVLTHLLPRDLWFNLKVEEWKARRQERQSERQRRALMKDDIPLGTQVPEITIPSVGGRVVRLGDKPVIIVFIGTCTSCLTPDLFEWEQVQREEGKRLGILFVSRDSKQRIREFLKQNLLTVPIIPDERGLLAKAYNAIWTPRIYGIDENTRLVWIQKDTSVADAHTIAQEIWKRRGGAEK